MLVNKMREIVNSKKGFDLKSTDSYEDVIAQIGGEASDGHQSCTFSGCLRSDIISQLQLDGFFVEVRSLDDSVRNNATFVSWK